MSIKDLVVDSNTENSSDIIEYILIRYTNGLT